MKSWSSCFSSEMNCTQSKTPCLWTSKTWPGQWGFALSKERKKPGVVWSLRIRARVSSGELPSSLPWVTHLISAGISCLFYWKGSGQNRFPKALLSHSRPPLVMACQGIRASYSLPKSGQRCWPSRTLSWRTGCWGVGPQPSRAGVFPAHEQPRGGCHRMALAVTWPDSCSHLPCPEGKGTGVFPQHQCHQIVLTGGGETPGLEFPGLGLAPSASL